MAMAVEAANLVRRLAMLSRRDPAVVGIPIWQALRLTATLTLEPVTRTIQGVGQAPPEE